MTDKITIEREALLPCPFCGAKAEILTIPEDHPDVGAMFVQCCDSRCMTSSALLYPLMDDVRALLVERWNRRAALAAQPAEPVAWINRRVIYDPATDSVTGYGEPELSFERASYGYDYANAKPLVLAQPAPAAVLPDEYGWLIERQAHTPTTGGEP